MILREMGTFAYQEGLIFEGELLHKGGKKMAFAGAFARPPRNSHEVLQPESYINGEKLPPVRIPDMREVVSDQYDVYDSGGIGELDVRALLKQYGERKIADEISAAWQGGVVCDLPSQKDKDGRRHFAQHGGSGAAVHFAMENAAGGRTVCALLCGVRYRSVIAVRPCKSVQACSGANCPVSIVADYVTEEGPVIVEHWKDNSVIVSESFDTATAARLRTALRDGTGAVHRGESAAGRDWIAAV